MTVRRKPALSNVRIYRAIADAAYREMVEDMERNGLQERDGIPRVVKRFDPEQISFKQAMISIVFTCIWLEATLHLLIVGKYGRTRFGEIDRYPYERKLAVLGCGDTKLLGKAERLRKARRDLIHEKAHFEINDEGDFTGKLWTAQNEAENARAVLVGVERWLELAN